MILEKVSCTNFFADASSSGDVSVKNLNAADVSADASSSGDVIWQVFVRTLLTEPVVVGM